MCATFLPWRKSRNASSAFARAVGLRPLYLPSAFAFAMPSALALQHVDGVAAEIQDAQRDTLARRARAGLRRCQAIGMSDQSTVIDARGGVRIAF